MAKKKIEPSKVEPVMEMSTNGIPTFKFKMTNIGKNIGNALYFFRKKVFNGSDYVLKRGQTK